MFLAVLHTFVQKRGAATINYKTPGSNTSKSIRASRAVFTPLMAPANGLPLPKYLPLAYLPANKFGNRRGCSDEGGITGNYAGYILMIDRGNCTFAEKLVNAYAANASGVIIRNYQARPSSHVP